MHYAIVLNILKFISNDYEFTITGSNRRLFYYVIEAWLCWFWFKIYSWFNNWLVHISTNLKNMYKRIFDSKDILWLELFKIKSKCLKLNQNLHQVPPAFTHADLSWYCPVRLHFPAMSPDVKTHPSQGPVIFFQLLQLYPASLIVAMATTTRRTISVDFCILILIVAA